MLGGRACTGTRVDLLPPPGPGVPSAETRGDCSLEIDRDAAAARSTGPIRFFTSTCGPFPSIHPNSCAGAKCGLRTKRTGRGGGTSESSGWERMRRRLRG